MKRLIATTLIAFIAFTAGARAESITGTILVKRKLTKRRVTAPVSIYQRGAAVKLGENAETDPLEFERSHVVIYLDGPGPAENASASAAQLPVQQAQQIDRQFSPDLLVVPVGSTVSFPNMERFIVS